jgi:chromosome segregation ATPase
MSNKTKRDSPLVQSVLALDNYLSELERVGSKINSTDLSSDFDIDFIQKLLSRFAECGQGVSEEVANLSTRLREAQSRAETIAQGVTRQAELFNTRRKEQNEKMDEFRVLGERVRELTAAIAEFRPPQGTGLTTEDREKLKSGIPGFEAQLAALIEDLQKLRESARSSRMKGLQKSAESLAQTLQAVQKRLREIGA